MRLDWPIFGHFFGFFGAVKSKPEDAKKVPPNPDRATFFSDGIDASRFAAKT
jgi:hypothetical protein